MQTTILSNEQLKELAANLLTVNCDEVAQDARHRTFYHVRDCHSVIREYKARFEQLERDGKL
jgi:hypothetical protein